MGAGMPHPYWDCAAECFCFLRNTAIRNGDSAWNRLHGQGHFKGPRIPFGALVSFKPSSTIARYAPLKHDASAVPGVFMGYKVSSGYTWNKQFKVAMLEDFVGRNFHRSCTAADHRFSIHTVGEVWYTPCTFPLRDLWNRDNVSVLGIEARLRPPQLAFDVTPPALPDNEADAGDDPMV